MKNKTLYAANNLLYGICRKYWVMGKGGSLTIEHSLVPFGVMN